MIVWRDYLALCKPRVVVLMLITAWVGMVLAPLPLYFSRFVIATLGIALSASAGAVINHLVEEHIDAKMYRTQSRPVASGRLKAAHARWFATILAVVGLSMLYLYVNPLTALLTALSLVGYGLFYTLYLKPTTPQNIVIGGLAGAAPPLLGWASITGTIDPGALVLVLIIFTWTPPHFWALALYRREEYAKAGLPMLPVTHGVAFTKLWIVLYTLLLLPITALPCIIGMSGLLYGITAFLSNGVFLYKVIRLYYTTNELYAMHVFRFSIIYLFILFIGLLVDHGIIIYD